MNANKTVLITGATRGIGLGLAKHFHSSGWKVLGTARDISKATELAKCSSQVLELDIKNPDSIRALAGSIESLDLLIHNAGILHRIPDINDVTVDTLMDEYLVNTIGPFLLTRDLMPKLIATADARMICIGSYLGSITNNANGKHYGYRASKAANHMIFKTFSVDYPLVPILLVHPGHVKTEMGAQDGQISIEESVSNMWMIFEEFLEKPQTVSKWKSGQFVHSITQELLQW